MTKKQLKKEIKKALKEYESYYSRVGCDAYDCDTTEGYMAYLLSSTVNYLEDKNEATN